MRTSKTSRVAILPLFSGVWLSAAAANETARAPEVEVQLLSERTALVPGEAVTLAIQFKIEEGWHTYWRNRGESGREPKFSWRLPEGFKAGPPRFPPPKRHVDREGLHTFVLEHEPAVLTRLTVPSDLKPGRDVTIEADVEWLVCKEACYRGSKLVSLTLPVVASEADTKPANEATFRLAREALPQPAGRAQHLNRLWAAASVDKVQPGAAFQVAVVLEVPDDHHLNAHKPLSEFLVPTDLFHDRSEGLRIGRARFPEGKIEASPLSGQGLSVYRGRTVITLPVEAGDALEVDRVRISGVVTYQACSDKKNVCFPPTAAEWVLTLPVAKPGELVAGVNKELFAAAPPAEPKGTGFTLDADVRVTTIQQDRSLLGVLALALLAGLILNVTPCVLPVISIKVLSFVQQASESPAKLFKLGLAFSLGMVVVFNILAVLATGLGLVWGQHFQSPHFTIAMSAIVFAFGLSLFGVFTLGVPRAVGDLAGRAEAGEGYAGSIAKGALATVMGTPCLGPFLGSVLVWAAAQPAAVVFLVFNAIGIGMALPYVLLTANPNWLRFVPKPGPWLETFKHAMGFLLMATVVYLLDILQGQLGGAAVVWSLVFLIGVGLGCWIVGRWVTVNSSSGRRAAVGLVSLAVVGVSGWLAFGVGVDLDAPPVQRSVGSSGEPDETDLPWVAFSLEKLTELTAADKTVFLDITAKWCPNCKYNLAWVFNSAEVAAAVEEYDVVPVLADWTARDDTISRLIDKLAPGASIPLCAVFPARRPDHAIVMLGIVTRQQVIDALREAANAPAAANR